MIERTLCGLEIEWDNAKTPATPFRHRCRCSPLWCSVDVCHRCTCVACTTERAGWDRHIKKCKADAIKRRGKIEKEPDGKICFITYSQLPSKVKNENGKAKAKAKART